MKQTHYSRKTRQLKRLISDLNDALRTMPGRLDLIDRLKAKISSLLRALRSVLPKYELRRALGTLAAVFGLTFATQVHGQYFTVPVENAFGLAPNPGGLGGVEMVDLDADGDFDLIQGGYYGVFEYFENTGTAAAPMFAAPQQNPFGLVSTLYYSFPEAADLDGDGDFDLLIGEYYGNMQYFENTGTAGAPAFAAPVVNPFGITAGYYVAWPDFVDLDADGDLDLLVGEVLGNMLYFENTGTVNAPAFAAASTNPFGLQATYLIAAPEFVDLDGDGDMDLLVGEYAYGNMNYFENTGTTMAPAFAAPVQDPFGLTPTNQLSHPATADLDADGDPDLVVCEQYAILQYFENINCTPAFGTDVQVGCGEFTWLDGNTYTSDNNTAMYAISGGAVSGCDSIITLDLTMTIVEVGVMTNDPFISAVAVGANYQWLDCDNGYTPVAGATAQDFAAPSNGDYAVEVTESGCADTSMCVTISTVGLDDNAMNLVEVYPNPTDGSVNINLGDLKPVTIQVLSADGKVVYRKENISSAIHQFDFAESPGVYFVEIISDREKKVVKLVKE